MTFLLNKEQLIDNIKDFIIDDVKIAQYIFIYKDADGVISSVNKTDDSSSFLGLLEYTKLSMCNLPVSDAEIG